MPVRYFASVAVVVFGSMAILALLTFLPAHLGAAHAAESPKGFSANLIGLSLFPDRDFRQETGANTHGPIREQTAGVLNVTDARFTPIARSLYSPYTPDFRTTQFAGWLPDRRAVIYQIHVDRDLYCDPLVNDKLGMDIFFVDAPDKEICASCVDRKGTQNLFLGSVFSNGKPPRFVMLAKRGPMPGEYTSNMDGSDRRIVTTDIGVHGLSASFDGLLFAKAENAHRIDVFSGSTYDQHDFIDEPGRNLFAGDWSPKAHQLFYFSCDLNSPFASTVGGEYCRARLAVFARTQTGWKHAVRDLAPSLVHDWTCPILDRPGQVCGLNQEGGCQIFSYDTEHAAWAPDGGSVFFSARRVERLSQPRRIFRVWVARPPSSAGSDEAEVVSKPLERDARFPTVSPDGSRLAFSALVQPGDNGYEPADSSVQVFVADLNAKSAKQVSHFKYSAKPRLLHWGQ